MTLHTSGSRQQSVWAGVVSDEPMKLRAWLVGLGFVEDLLIPGERPGAVHHCQLDWPEGGRVMLSGTGERQTPCLPGTSWQHVVTADPDAVLARAGQLGADVVQPIADQSDYPAREFTVATPTAASGPSRRSPGSSGEGGIRTLGGP